MSSRRAASTAIPFAVACLGIALFTAMDAAMKGLSIAMGAYNAMLWRVMIGAVISAVPFVIARGRMPSRAGLRVHFIRGGVSAVMAVSFFYGIARVPMAEGIAISFIAPLIALYLAVVMLGETVGRHSVIASILGIAGVLVLVVARANGAPGERHLDGVAAILLSAVFYAWNIILMRQQALLAPPTEVAFFQNLTTGSFLLLAAPFWAILPAAGHLPLLGLSALLAMCSLLSLSWAYARAEAQVLVPVEYTAFIWAAIMGAIFYAEALTIPTLIGAALIVTGCIIAARGRTARYGASGSRRVTAAHEGEGLTPLHLLLAVAVMAVWGTNFLVIKVGLAHLPPLLLSALRFAAVFLPAPLFVKRPQASWLNLAGYGVAIGVGQFGAMFIALRHDITPGLASLVVQTQVFFTIGLSMMLTGERMRGFQLAALLLAASGLGIIVLHTDGSATPLGLALVVLAAFGWATGNIIARAAGRVDMLGYVVWASVFAVPPLFALSLAFEGWPAIVRGVSNADAATWAVVAWQAVGNAMFGYAVWGWLLARSPAATVAPLSLLVPVFGMGASTLLLNESLPLWKLAAAGLVISGLAIGLLWPRLAARRTALA